MSVFTENINIAPLPKEWKWITTKPLRFYIYELWVWPYIDIPSWFKFDWCSIPICVLWARVNPKTINPCCLHDWLFMKKTYWYHFSNYIFYKSLRICWVWFFKALFYFVGVTLGGWIRYYQIVDKISVSIKKRLNLSEFISNIFKNGK